MSHDLTQGPIARHLWKIAGPASMGMLFETMFNVVDSYWAGTLSTTALAALSVSFPVFFFIIALSQGLATAASALSSYQWGKKETHLAREVGAQVLLSAFITSAVITAAGFLLEEPLFALMGVTGTYLQYALDYIHSIFAGSFLFVFFSAMNGLLLARGNARIMQRTLVGGFFLNCILDPWFLYGGWGLPAFGIAGIAYATLVVKALALGYVLRVAFQEVLLSRRLAAYWPDWRLIAQIFGQAIPSSMNMLTIASGILVTNLFIKTYGEAAVGAYGVSLRIEQLFLLPVIGIAISVLAISGQNFGAGDFSRIRAVLRQGLGIGFAIMTVGSALMLTMPEQLVAFFSQDPQVIAYGSEYLLIAALISWSYALSAISNSVLQGVQKPLFVFLVGFGRQFLLRYAVFYAVSTWTAWGLKGLWWALFGLNWVAAIATYAYARRLIRKQ